MKKLVLAATVGFSLSMLAAGLATAAGLDGSTAASESSITAQTSASVDPQDEGLGNGSLALEYTQMTPIEVTYGAGIEYTIDQLEEGDVVTTDLNDDEVKVDEYGSFHGSVALDSKPAFDSTVDFTVTVKRSGKTIAELPASVKIVEGDRGAQEPGTLLLGEESLTADDIADKGMNMSMIECSAGDWAVFEVFRQQDDASERVARYAQAVEGEDGNFAAVTYMPFEKKESLPGDYTVKAQCGDHKSEETFTVDD